MMNMLYIIPARGGSKGIPGKNIKLLNGKPLICYSIDVARELAGDEDICVSTDDLEIIKVVENYGLKTYFVRPAELATDVATTNDVLLHALNFFAKLGRNYDGVVLLQPTSPLRKGFQVSEALKIFNADIDMVVSVKLSHAASAICSENRDGFLELEFAKNVSRRQDMSTYYEYNGAIYIINVNSLKKFSMHGLPKKVKYIMPDIDSIDIDNMIDWRLSEMILANNL